MGTLIIVVVTIILQFPMIYDGNCIKQLKEINTTVSLATANMSYAAMVSDVSSLKPILTSEYLTNSNVTERISSTTTQLTCLPVQVLLAIFVLISTISIVLNIYFFIHMKRKNSVLFSCFEFCKTKVNRTWQQSTPMTAINNKGNTPIQCNGKETVPESYTELEIENLATGSTTDSDNQYDSLAHQDNYINVNMNFP